MKMAAHRYLVPTTLATTGPVWKPARMATHPSAGLSSSTAVSRAAATHRKPKRAMRATWSSACLNVPRARGDGPNELRAVACFSRVPCHLLLFRFSTMKFVSPL